MDDVIYRQQAIDALCNDYCGGHQDCKYYPNCENLKSIKQLPSAQPEAKPPKWVAEDRYVKKRFAIFPHCPRCNAGITTGQCYCMICGQHIDWSEDDG